MTVLTEEMSNKTPSFDWIYVDGSHEADDTMLDAELVWRLAKKNSIIIFDDYLWDKEPEDSMHHPKRGIDAFLLLHQGEYERLSDPSEYQFIIKKLTEMRIGFLAGPSKPSEDLDTAFGYSINIAFIVDSVYAVGAAVAIRSLVDTTQGRVAIYIVDCGLSDASKAKLQETAAAGPNITIKFVALPEDSMTTKMGVAWAKLDMIEVLPVERVLYLDADVLVRKDVGQLWRTDLKGGAVGAAVDVGYPMGHEGVAKQTYFNAGVLLMDLAKVRQSVQELRELGKRMEKSEYRDQDALNHYFAGKWTSISLEWNAQGLGTYENHPSEDRSSIAQDIKKMQDPAIVHFTGPVNPSLSTVLNPFVQPPTAKPWGYLGAPGHPFEGEWWDILEKTPWKGFKSSPERLLDIEEKVEAAVAAATRDFRAKLPRA
ncbi:nucleotide-diphospho-sugar transferase [Crepidotus variabilis]|uniref:Nucleotide-diphospho-sugar transferase n=1 Tax=Crepidotus variabilis TaxID=179855 RepID=A0A9P6JN18_9AGAR|nr:nucleotide-diphospho-sugar transferase [Crepidotus variabilis]